MTLTSVQPAELATIPADALELKWDCLDQSLLGSGKFGHIYHVFYDGFDAVLKRSRNEDDEAERENVMREAQVVASLNNCANVIRIYGVCEQSPFRGMIMEYCAGPSLAELVFQLNQNQVKVEALRVYKWCHELARTLCELNVTHFHGDLKPQNVIVKERPCCCPNPFFESRQIQETTYSLCQSCKGVHLEQICLKIIDFGMSFKHGTPRNYGGTLQFGAPETVDGTYDEKSEVFSFGLLMLTLVIGKPTDECDHEQKMFLTMRNNPTFIKCNSNSICETITACTHDDPTLRPTFKVLYEKLNKRHDHYKMLRGIDSRTHANQERQEFLDHYKFTRKSIRTVTTSTFLSESTEGCSTSQILSDAELQTNADILQYTYENNVFVDSPFSSPPVSRKNSDGYELPRRIVENPVYTNDEAMMVQLPYPTHKVLKSKKSVWRSLVQAKNVIVRRLMRWR